MLLEVGRIEKAHGLRGEVVVKLTTNVTERVLPGSVLALDPQGQRHLEVLASRRHQHRWIVGFAGLASREDADAVHGVTLYAEPLTDDDDPDALWIHELIGATVIDQHGTRRGIITSVIDNPASDLLELDNAGLVPLRFVTSKDGDQVHVDIPVGLLDDDGAEPDEAPETPES
jgi:16S rRNA processing protein RimM